MSSLSKGKSTNTKLVELFANRVVERRNMINDYLRGRACIESVRGSVDFELLCWFWALEFALSSLCVASDEQYESIPDDEIALLARKFWALHRFCKERRRSPRGCIECNDTTHFIADCPKRKKFDSSNKYKYNNWNDSEIVSVMSRNSAMRGTVITISLSMTSLTDSVVLKDTFQEVSRPIPET
jgi:hypothetical protein